MSTRTEQIMNMLPCGNNKNIKVLSDVKVPPNCYTAIQNLEVVTGPSLDLKSDLIICINVPFSLNPATISFVEI